MTPEQCHSDHKDDNLHGQTTAANHTHRSRSAWLISVAVWWNHNRCSQQHYSQCHATLACTEGLQVTSIQGRIALRAVVHGVSWSMYSWKCVVSLFIYISVTVFLIVGGQPTTDDATDEMANMQDKVAKLEAKVAKLEAEQPSKRPDTNGTGGVTYIRWGRLECEDNGATLLYNGDMSGQHFRHGGGGSNYLCLPEEPQWNNRINVSHTSRIVGWIYGTIYAGENLSSFFSMVNNGGQPVDGNPAACAVCYASQRSASVMIPAATDCPVGWTYEYGGYLMSEQSYSEGLTYQPRHSTSYVCVDQAPEVAPGGVYDSRFPRAHIFMVIVGCGILSCSKYNTGWQLACVVCTK